MRPLAETARETIARYGMLVPGQVVVAMVSGGADSTALLRLLASGEAAADLRLWVLHVDHMLRGEASAADAEFVRALCERLGVPCEVVRYDVAAYAEESGLNLEDAGRRVRYRFAEEELDARCDGHGVPPAEGRIATAHTLDDQAETFLMRLLAGSGPAGLAAIPPLRGRIVRPLIDARRDEVVAYLRGLDQSWREDVTNVDVERKRALVRRELVPVAERVNPRFREALGRAARILAEEDALLDETARDFLGAHATAEDGVIALDVPGMLALTLPVRRRVVRKALAAVSPEASRIEASHVDAVVLGMAEEGFARDLPYDLRAAREYGRMVVSRRSRTPRPLAPALLSVPGTSALGESGWVSAEEADPARLPEGPDEALVDGESIGGGLTVDSPRPGDRMRPLGMTGTRKVSDMLTDAKVPRRLRPLTPVVRDGERIVWVAGVRVSEDHKVRPETRWAVLLRWRRGET